MVPNKCKQLSKNVYLQLSMELMKNSSYHKHYFIHSFKK